MNHVTIDTAKQLKDNGTSEFVYIAGGGVRNRADAIAEGYKIICHAPTFDEVWEALPDEIEFNDNRCNVLTMGKSVKSTCLYYNGQASIAGFDHTNPAEAAGRLLLWMEGRDE